jgi:hypothetical protein
MPDGWAKIKGAAKYSGVSERTFRNFLKEGLKYSRLPSGTIVVQYGAIDRFLRGYEVIENEVDELADMVCKEIGT